MPSGVSWPPQRTTPPPNSSTAIPGPGAPSWTGAGASRYTSATPFRLGLVQTVLAIAGFILIRRRPVEWWFWAAVLLVSLFGISQAALPIWLRSDTLLIAQYPWRLLSIAGVPLALFVAGVPLRLRRGWQQAAAVAFALGLIVAANRPLLQQVAPHLPGDQDEDIAVIPQFEAETAALGTSLTGEFIPRWVESLPFDPVAPLTAPPVEIHLEHADPFTQRMHVKTSEPTALQFSSFYFPGWQAALDGVSVPVHPTPDRGLLSVDLPAGAHTLVLQWQETPLERTANALTLATLIGLALLLAIAADRQRWLALVPVALLAAVLLLTLRPPAWPAWRPATAHVQSDAVELLGFAAEQTLGRSSGQSSGRYLHITPYWRVKAPSADLRVRWLLTDPTGAIVAETAAEPFYASVTPTSWAPNTIVDDAYRLALPPGLPAGTYRLALQLDEASAMAVGDIELQATPGEAWPVMEALGLRLGDSLLIDGYTIEGSSGTVNGIPTVRPGDRLKVTLYWRAAAAVTENYHAFLHFVDAAGQPLVQNDHVPGQLTTPLLWDRFYPTPDIFWITIPDDARSGLYYPRLGAYSRFDRERLPVRDATGTEQGDAFALPPIKVVAENPMKPQHEVKARFGDFASLRGYSLAAPTPLHPGDHFTVTLVYGSDHPTPVDYTQFVQLYDPTLGMAAQHDAQPQEGGNPSSSWLPGEVISDTLALQVAPSAAPGLYQLNIGLYEADTGVRAPVTGAQNQTGAGDQVTLTELRVEETETRPN